MPFVLFREGFSDRFFSKKHRFWFHPEILESTVRDGTKGPRLHDWCYLELVDLDGEEFNNANQGLWTRGLLIRRHISDGDLAFFTTRCPAGTTIETLVAIEGHRWAIEDSLETTKNEFGLDHNGSRSSHGGIATFRW